MIMMTAMMTKKYGRLPKAMNVVALTGMLTYCEYC
jgi:hypothetical protein